MTSSTLFVTHGKFYEGTKLPSVCGKEYGIKKNNDTYVNNINTWAGSRSNRRDAADKVMYQLMDVAQEWYDVQDIVQLPLPFTSSWYRYSLTRP